MGRGERGSAAGDLVHGAGERAATAGYERSRAHRRNAWSSRVQRCDAARTFERDASADSWHAHAVVTDANSHTGCDGDSDAGSRSYRHAGSAGPVTDAYRYADAGTYSDTGSDAASGGHADAGTHPSGYAGSYACAYPGADAGTYPGTHSS